METNESDESNGFQLQHGCSILFDLFHNCSCKKLTGIIKITILAVKGRFKDYYRYGRVRSCMPYWNDFFLCLRLKLETDKEIAEVSNCSTRFLIFLD